MTAQQHRAKLRIVIVGHVDHGKSTLVGRLFHDTGSLPEGKMETIKAVCERRGMPFEWAFLMDALQAERDQGVTIDTAQIQFRTAARDYVIIDAPGHKEFLKNMVTGAASSEAALLLIDALEGVREQSYRHGYLLHLLGVQQVAVLVNKMDLVGYSADRFGAVAEEYRDYLAGLGVEPMGFIPISAREGDNIATRSRAMPWYQGPTVIKALDQFHSEPGAEDRPLRLPIQDVYKFDQRRIFAGRIVSGRLAVGDTLLFSPSNKTAKVKSIEAWSTPEQPAEAERRRIRSASRWRSRSSSSAARSPPTSSTRRSRATCSAGGSSGSAASRSPGAAATRLKLGTTETDVTVQSIERVIDTGDLSSGPAEQVERNAVAEVVLRTRGLLALDEHRANPSTGRFVLVEDYVPVGGGIISMEGYPDQRELVTRRATNITAVGHTVSHASRALRNGHKGGVMWFTGLSGSGKSTIALALEAQLFAKGYHVYVLDGDNVREGLNANLGFSPEDRAENIRRVGEVAALFADAGFLVISSFISPYRADRERARKAAEEGAFHEIYIQAPIEVCEQRDPKGLYKRARTGEIREFTGVSSPYEAPDSAELVVRTDQLSIEECLAELSAYVERAFAPES